MSKKQLKKAEKKGKKLESPKQEEKLYVLSYLVLPDRGYNPNRKGAKGPIRVYGTPDKLSAIVSDRDDRMKYEDGYKDFLIHEVGPGKDMKVRVVVEE